MGPLAENDRDNDVLLLAGAIIEYDRFQRGNNDLDKRGNVLMLRPIDSGRS